MVAYSFKRRFVPPILTGAKLRTIRADRARHARVGEEVQLYRGMRTSQCILLGTGTCVYIGPVVLDWIAGTVECHGGRVDPNDFAINDGFRSIEDMRLFWSLEHPGVDRFAGVMIRWRGFKPNPKALRMFDTDILEWKLAA